MSFQFSLMPMIFHSSILGYVVGVCLCSTSSSQSYHKCCLPLSFWDGTDVSYLKKRITRCIQLSAIFSLSSPSLSSISSLVSLTCVCDVDPRLHSFLKLFLLFFKSSRILIRFFFVTPPTKIKCLTLDVIHQQFFIQSLVKGILIVSSQHTLSGSKWEIFLSQYCRWHHTSIQSWSHWDNSTSYYTLLQMYGVCTVQ